MAAGPAKMPPRTPKTGLTKNAFRQAGHMGMKKPVKSSYGTTYQQHQKLKHKVSVTQHIFSKSATLVILHVTS
jgi:hypothetical protein